MNTLDAMKQAIKELHNHTESEHWRIAQASTCIREAIAHEESRAAKPDSERGALIARLRSYAPSGDGRVWQQFEWDEQQAADMLEQDGKELADVGDELTVAYMQGHSRGVEAGKKQAQQVAVPQDGAEQALHIANTRIKALQKLAVRVEDLELVLSECIEAVKTKNFNRCDHVLPKLEALLAAAPQPPQGEAG